MRIALVANPGSGRGTDPGALATALRGHGARVESFSLADPGALEAAAAADPERLVVAGGDGTIGPVADLAGRLGVALAVLPTGTANDFARAGGLPREAEVAVRLAATGATTRQLELGRLGDGRPFVNVASAGLAALASSRAQGLKPVLGPLAYAAGALGAGLTGTPLDVEVRAGSRVWRGAAWQVIVAVTGAFGGGSGVGVVRPDDGALDVVIVPAGPRVVLAHRAWGMRRHTIARQRGVRHLRGTRAEVRLPARPDLTIDGELASTGLEVVTVEPRAFALVVPDDAA